MLSDVVGKSKALRRWPRTVSVWRYMAVEMRDGRQGSPATDYRLIEVRRAGKAEADRFCASRLMFLEISALEGMIV